MFYVLLYICFCLYSIYICTIRTINYYGITINIRFSMSVCFSKSSLNCFSSSPFLNFSISSFEDGILQPTRITKCPLLGPLLRPVRNKRGRSQVLRQYQTFDSNDRGFFKTIRSFKMINCPEAE